MAKQVIKNYTFNSAAKTVTLTDFSVGQPVILERLALITDTTTNQIIYNFADSTVAQASISSGNVITLSTLPGGVASTDKLRIDYDEVTGDTTYDTPSLPNNAAKETGGNLASITTNTSNTATNTTGLNNTVGTAGSAIPSKGIVVQGSDGVNARAIKTDASGNVSVSTSNGALETGGNLATVATNTSNTATNTTGLNNTVGTAGSAIPSKGLIVQGSDGANARAIKTDASGNVAVNVQNSPNVTVSNASLAVTESGAWNVGSSASTGATVPSSAFYQGFDASTALPAAATAGNLVGAFSDKFGRQVVLLNAMRDLVSPITQLTLTSSTTETTLISAVASTFLDIVSLVVINTSATATQVDFRDSTGGTIRLSLYIPAGDTRGVALPVPLPQSAVNNNWTAKCGTSVASVIITGTYISNK